MTTALDTGVGASSRGQVHRWSQTLIPTTREAPADAESPSHVFLVRAGYIRRVGAGVYDYLPLAWRVLRKLSQIIREEMDTTGAAEMLMPAVIPMELFKATGRDEDYGDTLFRLTDRHGREAALGPTHEEVITEMMKGAVSSYKQLPLSLYQIQSKFRDEFRPRSGLLRGREFIMKDAYSFHLSLEGAGGLDETYDAMYQAYVRTFERCGLDFTVVEAESGPIGGSASHEFMVNAESGEDTILRCPESGYAANVEKCEIGERQWSFEGAPMGELEKVHTPSMPGIEGVAEFLGVPAGLMLKTIVFERLEPEAGEPEWVLAVVRGDHDVNEGKVRDAAGGRVALADEKKARAAGFAIGYVSPRAAKGDGALCKALVLIDPDAADGGADWATGADEHDHHVRHFNWRREMEGLLDDPKAVRVADVRNAMAGDPSPRATHAELVEQRGIEVGHIFKLGTKYSKAMGFSVLDQGQQRQDVIMGCYGLGVSRTMQACVEMSHDDNGIIWPPAIAPYQVLITVMKPDDATHMETAKSLSGQLRERGVDVLIDDRPERPGVKFKDGDLIGVPVRLTIGDKALAEGAVEFKKRADEGKGELAPVGEAVDRCLEALRE